MGAPGVFTILNLAIIVVYMVGVTAFGTLLGRHQKDARDYFLADRSIPWWAVCFSVVATETSVLTYISVPGTAYRTDMWMVQLAIGYLIGRIVVAAILLPGYFRGDIATAYELFETRFGPGARRFASVTFLITRALSSSVRLFATAIPIKVITGLPYTWAILITGLFTLVYTYYGGLRAVVWVDVLQMAVLTFGAVAALWSVLHLVPGGWAGIVAAAEPADKLRIFHFGGGFSSPTWILTGIVGGAFLSMASHGADHMIVQRLLAAPNLSGARKAIVASGAWIIAQFTLFLVLGVGMYAYFHGRAFSTPDEILPRFMLEGLPAGVAGLVIAGILAAAMSSEASALNSLASSLTNDIYAPLARREGDEHHLMTVGKVSTLIWGVLLVAGAVLFQYIKQDTPVVVIALQISSFAYGGLLGGFLLGLASRRARQKDVVLGMVTAVCVMTVWWALQHWAVIPKLVDPLWFSLLGSTLTVTVGVISSRFGGPPAEPRQPSPASVEATAR